VVAACHVDITTPYQTADGRVHPLPPGCGPVIVRRALPTQADAVRATLAVEAAPTATAGTARAATAAAAVAKALADAARAVDAATAQDAAATATDAATAPTRGSYMGAPTPHGPGVGADTPPNSAARDRSAS
jgi:hypothetical protein